MTQPTGSGIVDAHVHSASDDEARYPRHPTGMASDWWRRGRYEGADVLATLGGAGVSHMVLVQAAGAYDDDNRYVVDMAATYPEAVRAVVVVDPDAPGMATTITELAAHDGVSGVRCMAVRPSATWVGTARAADAFEAADDAGLTVVLTVFPAHLRVLRPVLERFPDVPVVLDHCAFPTMEGPAVGPGSSLGSLGDLPHVTVKVTSHNLTPQDGADGARAFVEQLVGWFGPGRIVWGSDYPQSPHESYAGLVELALEAFADLDPPDVAAVLAGNSRRLFGFATDSDVR